LIFARKLDRYVAGNFLRLLVLVELSLYAIYVLVHLMDHMNVYLDHQATWSEIGRYYANEIPYNLLLTLPMAMLIASILSVGDLGKHGELTAMKASGLSLYRIFAPVLVVGVAASLLSLTLGETIVPRLNERASEVYEHEILERGGGDAENYRGNFIYQNPEGFTYLVRALFVDDSVGGSADQVEVQRRYGDGTFLRINAPQMTWEPASRSWVLQNGEMRIFPAGSDEERMYRFDILRAPSLHDPPEILLAEEKDPEDMGYVTLREYIEDRERLGADTRAERVDLQMKIAYPFANVVILLFGVALVGSAGHTGRQRGGVGFGLALFLTIVFWGFVRVGQGIGYGGGMSPVAAAWMANAIFGTLACVLLLRART